MQLSKVKLFVFASLLSFSCSLQAMEGNNSKLTLPLLSFRPQQYNQPNLPIIEERIYNFQYERQKRIQDDSKKAIEFLQRFIHINNIIASRNQLSHSTIESINEIKEKIEATIKHIEDNIEATIKNVGDNKKDGFIIYAVLPSIIEENHAFAQTLKQTMPPIPWYFIQQLGLCSHNLSTIKYIPEN